MKFAKAVKAPKATKNQIYVSTLLAAVFTVMAVGQLFAFEEYPQLIASMKLVADPSWSLLIATGVVVAEVFAIPFLLRMSLSPLMRIVSQYVGWIALFYWFMVSLWQVSAPFAIDNSGFLGSKIHFLEGWSLLTSIVIMMIAMTYVGINKRK